MDADFAIRVAAIEHLHALSRRFDDRIPRSELLRNLERGGTTYALVNPQSGIHRPKRFHGPAALTIVTTAPRANASPPYEDAFDEDAGIFSYSYRQGPVDSPDNRALRAAVSERAPLIYLVGIEPGLYSLFAPVYLLEDRPHERSVVGFIGDRVRDLTPAGIRTGEELRRYAIREAKTRLHQHRFSYSVLTAYRHRCTICALRERSLLQAAHIVEDAHERGTPVVRNGLALCAIHHLAFDRNVLGIDPRGVVHLAPRVLDEEDGPMLREGLQSFHGRSITLPARSADRPDPERLELRYERFLAA